MEHNTVLVTNGNLLSMISLGPWLLKHLDEVKGIFVTTRLPSQKSNVAGVLNMLRNSGWAYTHFKVAVNKLIPLRLKLRGLPTSVEALVRRAGGTMPVRKVATANAPDVVEQICSLDPDYLLSFSATHRFKEPLITSAKVATINAHYALLPEYAGISPYFWYLRNGEATAGVTLHQIVLQLDAGDVIEQVRFSTEGINSVLGLALRDAACVSPMLDRFYGGETGLDQMSTQDLSKRSYFKHPTKEDVKALRKRGVVFSNRAASSELDSRVRELARQADGRKVR